MKKIEAAVTAYVHAGTIAAIVEMKSEAFGTEQHVQLSSAFDWLLNDTEAPIATSSREEAAERLFDYALKYKYGPEVLYRQQEMWLGRTPLDWELVDPVLRLRYALFHASTNALAPFIDQAPAAEAERSTETRSHGFEKGFDDEGEGRGTKIGDDRLPVTKAAILEKPVADIADFPRENLYTCQTCASSFTTVDVDHGVTPFMTACRVEGCTGSAQSAFYPKGPRPAHVPAPSFEWYRPEAHELSGFGPNTIDHLKKGGLIMRPRTDREPIKHGSTHNDWERVTAGVDALFGEGTTAAMQAETARLLAAKPLYKVEPVTGAVEPIGNKQEAPPAAEPAATVSEIERQIVDDVTQAMQEQRRDAMEEAVALSALEDSKAGGQASPASGAEDFKEDLAESRIDQARTAVAVAEAERAAAMARASAEEATAKLRAQAAAEPPQETPKEAEAIDPPAPPVDATPKPHKGKRHK